MFNFLKKREILVPSILIVCMLLFIGIRLALKDTQPSDEFIVSTSDTSTVSTADEPELIGVHIKGAVHFPGFYEVERGLRVNDLIKLAGGMTDDAYPDAINLAEHLFDAMEVYLPTIGEIVPNSQGNRRKININTASAKELEELPNIGPVSAEKIIEVRQRMGGFKKIEDIMNVQGISEARFEAIKDLIIVP